MSILFIDTGWKDLGFALFDWEGDFINSSVIENMRGSQWSRVRQIADRIQLYHMSHHLDQIVFENYTVHDDPTGKSKKGQMTLFCNGVVAGIAVTEKIDFEEVKNGHWSDVYSRYKVDHTLKGLPVLTPPKNANEHASDAFKMGVAWLVEKGVIK